MKAKSIGDNQSIVFFRESATTLKIAGIWKDCTHLDVKKRNITGALILLVLGLGLSICAFSGYLDLKINGDLADTQRALVVSFGIFLCTTKLYSMWSSETEIKRCLRWLQEFSRGLDDQTFIKHALRLYRMFFIVGMVIVTLTVIFFILEPIKENSMSFPMATKNPVQFVNILQSPAYEIFYLYQIVSITILAICMTACDTMFCGIMLMIEAFFKTINAFFVETFISGAANDMSDKEKEEAMIRVIENFIETLRIVEFVKNIFNLVTLSTLLFNMTVTGLALYISTVVPFNSASFWSMAMILLFEIFQLGIYCFFGEAIVTQNRQLRYNIYQCDWYNQSRLFKLMVLLTLQRTENEPFITAGKLVPLCNETFAEILKMAYSVCTFLYSFREA